jgi:hypothetical protein
MTPFEPTTGSIRIAATRFGSSCMRMRSMCSIARAVSSSSVVAWNGERYG